MPKSVCRVIFLYSSELYVLLPINKQLNYFIFIIMIVFSNTLLFVNIVMISNIAMTSFKALAVKNLYLFARGHKKISIKESLLPVSKNPIQKQSWLKDLLLFCQQDNKQSSTRLLDRQFYNGLARYDQASLKQFIKINMSVMFYFRDYSSILMSLKNQEILFQNSLVDTNINHSRIILLHILSNHQALETEINRLGKKQLAPTFRSLYVKALGLMVIGKFKQAQAILVQLINSRVTQFNRRNQGQKLKKEAQNQYNAIFSKINPNYLSLDEQVLINILCYHIYKDSETKNDGNSKKTTAVHLFRKIKQNKKLDLSDFEIDNYEQFLNFWVSAKHDASLKWTDLNVSQKVPFFKYIYLLAESSYLRNQKQKCNEILKHLPQNYPLKNLLQIGILYDDKNYKQARQMAQKIYKTMQNKNIVNFYKLPEFDIIRKNILEVMKKIEESELKASSQKEYRQQKQQIISQIQQQIQIFCEQNCIRQVNGNGIPFYYLGIPFYQFFVLKQLAALY